MSDESKEEFRWPPDHLLKYPAKQGGEGMSKINVKDLYLCIASICMSNIDSSLAIVAVVLSLFALWAVSSGWGVDR